VLVTNWTQRGDERWPNNDGIDIDSSSHVLVEKSSIDTADDGVSSLPIIPIHPFQTLTEPALRSDKTQVAVDGNNIAGVETRDH
jgi:hypothetical protein